MARNVPWRRTCPECVVLRAEQALRATIYILHQTGPTGFVLKEEGGQRKLKVFLGDVHSCSCSVFKKEKELCIHILWVLLKRFRVPRENPVSFQLGLVEREINEVLQGYLRWQKPTESGQSNQSSGSHATQKEVGPDDVCPICQDELLGRRQPLTYCKFGCGKSVHIKCMKIWAEHQRTNGEKTIRCPLCREDFGPLQELRKELHSTTARRLHAERSSLHLGVTCNHCHACPIAGKCYRCTTCASYHLCQACFASNHYHMIHSFEFRKHPSQPWRPAVRTYVPSTHTSPNSPRNPTLPPSLVDSLHNRSLTENDYELLLQLDGRTHTTASSDTDPRARPSRSQTQGLPERLINSFHVEPVDSTSHLLQNGGAVCEMCTVSYRRGDWVRKLPCKHKFHRDCIDHWLRSGHTACPVDGHPLCTRRNDQPRKILLSRRSHPDGSSSRAPRRIVGPLAHAVTRVGGCNGGEGGGSGCEEERMVELTLSGQSIGAANRAARSSLGSLASRRCSILTTSSVHRVKAISTLSKSSSSSSGSLGSDHGRLPKIKTTGASPPTMVEVCSRRNVVESTKRMLKRRKSISPTGGRENGTSTSKSFAKLSDGHRRSTLPLAPTCHGYGHTVDDQEAVPMSDRRDRATAVVSLPPLYGAAGYSSPPLLGRLRKGSLVSGVGWTRGPTATEPETGVELDSSLCVSSFKLCPLPTTSSVVMASSQL